MVSVVFVGVTAFGVSSTLGSLRASPCVSSLIPHLRTFPRSSEKVADRGGVEDRGGGERVSVLERSLLSALGFEGEAGRFADPLKNEVLIFSKSASSLVEGVGGILCFPRVSLTASRAALSVGLMSSMMDTTLVNSKWSASDLIVCGLRYWYMRTARRLRAMLGVCFFRADKLLFES